MTATGTTRDDRACNMESQVVRIKRYPNRRFYDRTSRKYITLQDIEELVRRGHTVDVRDSRNDEDLTRIVLTQILLERHPERMEMFPVALLHIILRANDLALEFLRVFLRLSLATLESFQGTRTLAPFVSPFDWMRLFFPGFLPGGPRQSIEPSEATVEQLYRRVAELEDRIRHLESGSVPIEEPRAIPDLSPRSVRELEGRRSK
jgi:polyhydroxyalkanoate synthesis repressor PhaR